MIWGYEVDLFSNLAPAVGAKFDIALFYEICYCSSSVSLVFLFFDDNDHHIDSTTHPVKTCSESLEIKQQTVQTALRR